MPVLTKERTVTASSPLLEIDLASDRFHLSHLPVVQAVFPYVTLMAAPTGTWNLRDATEGPDCAGRSVDLSIDFAGEGLIHHASVLGHVQDLFGQDRHRRPGGGRLVLRRGLGDEPAVAGGRRTAAGAGRGCAAASGHPHVADRDAGGDCAHRHP